MRRQTGRSQGAPQSEGLANVLDTVSALAVVRRRWEVAGRTVPVATLRERNRSAPRPLTRQVNEDSAAAVTPTSARDDRARGEARGAASSIADKAVAALCVGGPRILDERTRRGTGRTKAAVCACSESPLGHSLTLMSLQVSSPGCLAVGAPEALVTPA